MTDKKFKVAIIGLQHLHPENYMPHFVRCENTEVVAVCEQNKNLLIPFSERHGVAAYTDIDTLLDESRPDIAAIFLPHIDCEEAAIKCAQKGVHLMVEKPIAQTPAQVRNIAKAVEAAGVSITTGYCWRYHPVVKAIKKLISQGAIGQVVSVEARLAAGKVDRYINGNAEWMLQKDISGGGPLYNLGVHWLDLLNFVLEDKVTDVCAVNMNVCDKYDIEDGTVAMLKFAKGVVGILDTSYIVPDCYPNGRDLYIGIKGTNGVLSYAPGYEGEAGSGGAAQNDVLEIYSDSEKLAGSAARKMSFQLDRTPGYSGYMGRAYIEEFVDSLIKAQKPFITIEQAADVLDVVEAIYKSDSQGGWVKVLKIINN
ncbi:MAG: Gfo/Idh/MocA family protein [Sedimentisphaeraceae bacterium JB056]